MTPLVPVSQRSRTRSRCDCGGPCFYCGRALSQHRHEHDHFPIPWRHGGEDTVATCRECHSLKDRCDLIGIRHDGNVDEPVFAAMMKGFESLPKPVIVDYGDGSERVPGVVFLLHVLIENLSRADAEAAWGIAWEVDRVANKVAEAVPRCSTPEARIGLARIFASCLDELDGRLAS